MSAGEFVRSIYETNAGNFCSIRVQPETLSATLDGSANAAGLGPVNQQASAKASGGKREIGVIARSVTLRWTAGAPEDYSGDDVTIPIMTPGVYNGLTKGDTGTYLDEAVEVVGLSPERIN